MSFYVNIALFNSSHSIKDFLINNLIHSCPSPIEPVCGHLSHKINPLGVIAFWRPNNTLRCRFKLSKGNLQVRIFASEIYNEVYCLEMEVAKNVTSQILIRAKGTSFPV